MTAIVGILNKKSIALAADSALTINSPSGHKVLNSANKVFNISRKHPVGLMMYASASFMDTPWDLIIKMYRDQLQANSFPSLQCYVDDFIQFLRKNRFFCSEKMQHHFLQRHMNFYYNDVLNIAKQNCAKATGESIEKIPLTTAHDEMLKVLESHTTTFSSFPKCTDFIDYTLSDFQTDAQMEIVEIQKLYSSYVQDISLFHEAFVKSFHTYLCSTHIVFDRTGLVFVGYGDEEIYPSLIPLNISFVFHERIRGCVDTLNEHHIGEMKKAAICPFAQTDVMMTILTGIDNGIKELVYNTFDKTTQKLLDVIVGLLQSHGGDDRILASIANIDISAFSNQFKKSIDDFITEEYIKKLVETVEYLEKEDLANVAESLIALTSLKRRITSSEESVGGPVDVAVISKSDGFIWMKRKHYFDKNLNAQFFQRYNG